MEEQEFLSIYNTYHEHKSQLNVKSGNILYFTLMAKNIKYRCITLFPQSSAPQYHLMTGWASAVP